MHPAKTLALVLTFIPFSAFAEIEIEGTKAEVAEFATSLKGMGKVTLTATAEETLSSTSADVALSIVSNAGKLASAIKNNAALGAKLQKQLAASGIPASAISSQSLASTPEYGWFSDKPKSYTVASRFHVRISEEAQFLTIAKFVDTEDDVRYVGIKPHLEIAGAFTQNLEAAALTALAAKQKIYETAHGIKLSVHSFSECTISRTQESHQPPKGKASYGATRTSNWSDSRKLSIGTGEFKGTVSATYHLSAK